jgi:thymidylate kinase
LSRRGIVVALSGVDCAGKSTQCELLMENLRALGYEPARVWTRAGYTPGLEAVKGLLRRLKGRKPRERAGVSEVPSQYPRRAANLPNRFQRWLWVTSALLDLLWVYAVQLRVWRTSGGAVLCDRYLLDCLVDFRVNFPEDRIEDRLLCRLLRRVAVRPDVAICMLVPAEQTMERSRGKQRFHWETLDVLQQRYEQYRDLSAQLGILVLDGARPSAEIADTIKGRIEDALAVPRQHSPSC